MTSIAIDPASPVPAFEQLRAAITGLVERGELRLGARLPTVRQLSKDLALAPGTVARAFRELETDGVVQTRGRHGTFVSGVPRRSSRERTKRLDDAVDEVVVAAAAAGLDVDALLARIRNAYPGPR